MYAGRVIISRYSCWECVLSQLPSRMTVTVLGRKPGPPGHSSSYSAEEGMPDNHHEYSNSVLRIIDNHLNQYICMYVCMCKLY